MAIRTVLLLLLAGAAFAGPLQNQPSECRRSCLLSDMSKFRYASGKTYEYEVESESLVEVKTIQGQQASLKWSATVDLHFDSPCEVTLEIKNPRLQGEANAAFEQQLSSHPLRAVLADGTFEEVCADKDDITSAVNIKKGLLSQLQNTLPSNSTIFDGIEIHETDILGLCPTVYKVRHESGKVLVEKTKEHRLCSKRFGSSTEHPLFAVPLKAPFPLVESKSICKQEIEDGIVQSVVCVDENELSPMPGVQRTIKGQLKSKLTLKSVSPTSSIKSLDKPRKTSLLYDYTDSPKNSLASAKLESKLRELCATIEGNNVTTRTAQLYSELIQSMDQVEEGLISETLKNIKANKYCSGSAEKLEVLYLDAVASTHNTGAIPTMVEEILKGSRHFLYTWRLHTLPRVCIHGVQALKPIFGNESLPLPTILAAGSAVARYCATEGEQTKKGCLQEEPVQHIMETISAKIQQSCPSTKADKSKRVWSVALLKAVANIKNATEELRSTILSCFQQSNAALSVRVAAADTLRNIPCSEEITEKLLEDVEKSSLNTELRISAYKAAVMCANTDQLSKLIDEVTRTSSDSQVRWFILSDLNNLQQSLAPYKVAVRQRLARFNISQEYPHYFTRASRSFDISKFTQSGSFGSEIDYEVIFNNEEILPRQIRSNFTLALFKEIINVGEMGARGENLPGLFSSAVAPGTTLGKTLVGRMIWNFLQTQSGVPGKGQLELFVKIFGQEIFYSALSDVDQVEHDVLMKLYKVAGEIYQEMTSETQLQSFKGFQVKNDLVIPTIQGMPLHITKEITAVASVNATPSVHGYGSSLEFAPVLSAMANLFVGYKFGPSAGLKINTTVFSSSDTIFRVQLDWLSVLNVKVEFPRDEAELLKFEHKGYMMVKLPGQKELVKESASRDPRKQAKKCSHVLGGMQFCCDHDVLDLWQANDYPLVKKSHFKWTLKKESPSVKGIELKIAKQENSYKYRTKLVIPGTSNPTKFDYEFSYQNDHNTQIIAIESKVGQRPHGIKFVHSGQTLRHEMEVFVGGHQNLQKVFSGKFATADAGQLTLKVKTEGGLERLVLADVDVDVAVGQSSLSWRERRLSLKLKKFEVQLGAASCRAGFYIRKTPGSEEATQFVSQVQLSCNERQIFKSNISTTLQEQDQGLKLNSKLGLEHGSQRCEADVALILNPSSKKLSVKASSEGSRTLQFVVSDQKDSAQGRTSLIALKLPEMDIAWKVASLWKGSLNDGELDLSLLTQGREVLSIRGPISVTHTKSEKKQKSKLGIRFGQQGKTYHVTSEMEFAKQKCQIKAIVNEEQNMLFSYEHDFLGDGRPPLSPESQFSFISKIELPEIVKSDVSLKKTSSSIQSDAELKLEVISPRHIQAHVAVDTSSAAEGHVSAKLLWDKARDPEKKIDLSGTYRLQGEDHFSTHGEMGYMNEKFQYAVSYLLKMQKPWPNMEKDLKIEVMKGSEEVFTLKNMVHIETMSSGSLRVKSDAFLLTPYKNEYSCKKELDVVIGPSESSMKLESAFHASTVGESRMSLSVSSQGDPSTAGTIQDLRDGVVGPPGLAIGPPGAAPQLAVFGKFEAIGVNQQEPALSARWEGDLQGNVYGGFEKLNLVVSVEADRQKIEIEASENAVEMETRLAIKHNGQSLVRGQISRRQGKSSSAHINLPSRSIAITGLFSRHVKSLTIYPNKRESDEKIGARFSDLSDDSGNHLDWAVDYPHNGRQKKVIGSYRSQNQQTLGAMELDVFSEVGKALKVKISGTKVSRDILQLEASIQSNSTGDGPRVNVDLSTASRDMYIIAAYKKDSQSAPSIYISSKYIKQAAHAGVLSVLLQTPESKVEMGGVVSSVNNYGCQGYKLNGTLQSGRNPQHDLEIVTCSPAFIKIVIGLKERSERYVVKLGMESLLHAEMSLMKDTQTQANKWWSQLTGSSKERREVPVVAISAKLLRPTTLTLRAQYNKQTLAPTMSLAERELTSAAEVASSMVEQMLRQVSSDTSEAFPELKQALDGLAESLISIKEIPAFKEIARKALEARQYLDEAIERAVESVKEVSWKLESQWEYILEKLVQLQVNLIEPLSSYVDNFKEWLEDMFGPIEQIPERTVAELKNVVQKIERSAVGGKMKNAVQYLCEMYSSQCEYAQSYLEDYVQELKRDVHKFSTLILQYKSVQYARSLVRRAIDMVEDNQVSKMIQSLLLGVTKQYAGVYIEESTIQVNLPLQQPVGSVLTAVEEIGFTSMNQTIILPYWWD